jgi:uncharacterized protein YijF (DUF1287 family)
LGPSRSWGRVKRVRAHSRALVTELEDDEERTCLEEIGDGVREEEKTTTE